VRLRVRVGARDDLLDRRRRGVQRRALHRQVVVRRRRPDCLGPVGRLEGVCRHDRGREDGRAPQDGAHAQEAPPLSARPAPPTRLARSQPCPVRQARLGSSPRSQASRHRTFNRAAPRRPPVSVSCLMSWPLAVPHSLWSHWPRPWHEGACRSLADVHVYAYVRARRSRSISMQFDAYIFTMTLRVKSWRVGVCNRCAIARVRALEQN
jgi:hypothetical protein